MMFLSGRFQFSFFFNKGMLVGRGSIGKSRTGVSTKGSCDDGNDNDHVWLHLEKMEG